MENNKLKEESDAAKKTILELEQKLKDAKKTIEIEKKLLLATSSSLTTATENVDKATHEATLQKKPADDAEKNVESTLKDVAVVRDTLAKVREMLYQSEIRALQACKEATEKTNSKFLYTLWLHHPELDFSFFGKDTVEEVKNYAFHAARDTQMKAAQAAQKRIDPMK